MYYWPIKFINRLFRFSNENKTSNSEKYSRIQIGEINRTQHDIKNIFRTDLWSSGFRQTYS